MSKLMGEIEEAMRSLSNCAPMVMENAQRRTCWIAEVDIGIMLKVFAVPKTDPGGLSVSDQETEVRRICAQFIAAKLLELVELAEVPKDKIK